MKNILIVGLAFFAVLGTAKAGNDYELTVWIDKYQVNEVTPSEFVPVQVKFSFNKKSEIEPIYKNDLTQFGVKVRVISSEDNFVTYRWELFQMKKGKWSRVYIENDVVETMLGSSKLIEQSVTLPTKEKQKVKLQYIMSLDQVS